MIELYFPFDGLNHQLDEISNEITERENISNDFLIGNFEEFIMNTRLEEQSKDVPDTIWTLKPNVKPSTISYARPQKNDRRKV
jgi:hypothetical protein